MLSLLGWLCLGEPFVFESHSTPEVPQGVFDGAPVLHWSRPLPGGTVAAATHTERGQAQMDGEHIFLGSAGGSALYELHRASGELLFSYPAKASVQSAAVISEGHVFFADSAGYTFRFERTSSEPVWQHYGGAPVTTTPTVVDTRVYVANVDDLVYALDAETGALLWRYQHPRDPTRNSDLTLYGSPQPSIVGQKLLVGFSDGALVALDTETGESQWERRIGEGRYPDLIGTPLVVDNDLYIAGYSSPLVAMDLDSLSVRWRLDLGGASAPIVDGEQLYHGGVDGILRSVDRRTGEVAWTWDSLTTGALTTPQLLEAGLLVGSSDGSLYLVDPASGQLTWSYDPSFLLDGITVAPSVSGRQLIAVTNGGRILSMIVPSSGNSGSSWSPSLP